jgi:hypothetical protein
VRRFHIVVSVSVLTLVIGSCSSESAGPTLDETQNAFLVSNPILRGSIASAGISTSFVAQDERFTYVSAPPATFPDGKVVTIANITKTTVAPSAFVVNGGFDPVAVEADEGDNIRLSVLLASGAKVVNTVKVPARRPPRVVRTDPAKGRTDVAFSVSIAVVFSEPIDPKTVNPNSVYLTHDGTRIPGSVAIDANAWTFDFTPLNQLAPNSSYELVVTPAVRDLDGDALEGAYSTSFTTASASSQPTAPGGGSGISGVVFERTVDGPRPYPNAIVYAWVEVGAPGNFGYSAGGTRTDAQGRFTWTLPAGTITLSTWTGTHYQPCFKIISYDGGTTTANIELVPQGNPITTQNDPVVVQGLVYETTSSGRQPIAFATLYVDRFDDHNVAWTTTDAYGHYKFCALVPWHGFGPQIYAGKDGYEWSYNLLSLTGNEEPVTLDIELKH